MRDARRQTPDAKGLSRGGRVCATPVQTKAGMPRPSHSFGLLSEATSETGEHSLHMLQITNDRRHGLLVGHSQEHGNKQVGLQLGSRTQCDVDETAELSTTEPAASLGDVGCDRDRRPPTLRNETESFRLGKGLSYFIDGTDDNTTSLPHPEFPKVLHPRLVSRMSCKGNTPRPVVLRIPSRLDRQPVRPVPRAWPLASGVSHLPRIFNPSARSRASGVWRLASGVSPNTVAADRQ